MDKKITDVEVSSDLVLSLDIPMGTSATTLTEVVVTSEALRNTEGALMTLRRKAFSVQDGISSQEISRYGSSNAAESMKSVTGASVMGGKYVFLRGIGERYNSTTLNHQILPSVDPYRNAAQLDMIPANLLDNVVATKTFTPDQPGNSTGGNLNISTKSFPEKFTMALSMNASYNTVSSLRDDFLSFDGGSTDWLGFDDGGRDLPAEWLDADIIEISKSRNSGSLERSLKNNDALAQKYNDAVKGLDRQMTPSETSSFMNHGISFAVGNQVPLFNRPLGLIFNVNYNKTYEHFQNGELNFYELGADSIGVLRDYYELEEDRSTETPELGGMVGISYKLSNNSKISFTGIYNHNARKSANYIDGTYAEKVSGSKTYESRFLSFTERDIRSYQLNGEHVILGLREARINWNLGIVNSIQLEPNSRVFDNSILEEERNGVMETYYGISKSEFSLPFHFWRNLQDRQQNATLDISVPILGGLSKSNKLKFGGSYNVKSRSFEELILEYNNVNTTNGIRYDNNPEDFFGENNVGILDTTGSRPIAGVYLRNFEEGSLKNSYTGSENIHALYGMINVELGKLKIIGGARIETTDISVASRDTFFPSGNIDVVDILPSLNLIYALNDKINFRAAFTQTLARPNMRELAPFSSFDRGTDIRVTGNPDLQRTNIVNGDVRAEYFPDQGELIAVSAFYKRFEKPIVRAFNPRNANKEIVIVNVDEAKVYGLEMEFRKNLGFIGGGFLKKTRLITNLSLIHSSVDIPGHPDSVDTEQYLINQFNKSKGFTRPFQGQSPFILNTALNYSNSDNGIDALISFNVFGRRLVLNNGGHSPDFYENPIPQLDFSFIKTLGKNVKLKVSARNLLDADYSQSIIFGGNGQNLERTIESRRRGIAFGFGVSYQIN